MTGHELHSCTDCLQRGVLSCDYHIKTSTRRRSAHATSSQRSADRSPLQLCTVLLCGPAQSPQISGKLADIVTHRALKGERILQVHKTPHAPYGVDFTETIWSPSKGSQTGSASWVGAEGQMVGGHVGAKSILAPDGCLRPLGECNLLMSRKTNAVSLKLFMLSGSDDQRSATGHPGTYDWLQSRGHFISPLRACQV